MVRVKCKRCGYEWEYRGMRSRTCCPKCGTSVMVLNSVIDEVGSFYLKSLEREKRKVKVRVVYVVCPFCGESFVYVLDRCYDGLNVRVDLKDRDVYGRSFKEHVRRCVLEGL